MHAADESNPLEELGSAFQAEHPLIQGPVRELQRPKFGLARIGEDVAKNLLQSRFGDTEGRTTEAPSKGGREEIRSA